MGTLVTPSTESTTEVVSYTQPDSATSSTKELENEGPLEHFCFSFCFHFEQIAANNLKG
uniref:Uncharacterized protein n=1 Tax=Utricularia reniformis TaxID=192314 RepID=A0A1Y0B494_9LAMI|nr:hypothetical protein AEK19_MT2123 [Utricularia reniformis]ART32275.1 hypothetical protein AEK19_MT2123 [Utricularia reniformis]